MATIGDITVAFQSDIGGLESGIDQAVKLLNELKESAESITAAFGDIEKQRIDIQTSVDRSELDSVQADIASSSATLAVKAEVDASDVAKAGEEIEKLPKTASVEIKIDILVLEKVLAAANELIEDIKKNILDLGKKSISNLLAPLSMPFKVAGVMAGAYAKDLSEVAKQTESLTNLSSRFDMAYNSLELIGEAASRAGVSMGLLAKASQGLLQNVSKVRFGQLDSEPAKEAQIAFNRLGITMTELTSLSPDQVFSLVSQKLVGVSDAADRASIAFDLFGKQGSAILPALAGLEEARLDMERFASVTSKIDLSRLQGLDKSFDRLNSASGALSGTMLAGLVPLQTGWNNFLADLKGGFNAVLGPIMTMMASFTVGWQVLFEVIGRGVNILLRLVGAVTQVVTAMTNAPLLATGWQALGSAIMDVYAMVERLVRIVEAVAGAISSQLAPSAESLKNSIDITAPAQSFEDWGQKILVAGKYLGIVVVSLGVTQAALAAFGAQASVTATLVTAKNIIMSLSFKSVLASAISLFKTVTIGATGMAARYVAAFVTMTTSTLAGWIAPFVASVATFVTGSAVISTSATVTGFAVAAAWVVATLGVAALIVGIIALVQNFDDVYEYFANFSENAKDLFTLDGLIGMAEAVGQALYDVLAGIGSGILGWFAGIWQSISDSVMGIETPEIANAAKADAEEIAAVRRKGQEAEFARAKQIADLRNNISGQMSAATGGLVDLGQAESPEMAADDTAAVTAAIDSNREAMRGAIIDAAAFGEAGKKAALDSQQQFTKLQEQLALGTLSPEKFEEEAKRVREALQKNLKDLDILTDSEIFDFAKAAQDATNQAIDEFRKVRRGADAGSTFSESRYFPTSAEITEQAANFVAEFDKRNKEIADKLASGGFGEGQMAQDRANDALTVSREKFDVGMGKIKADTAFADEIRKSLETAFLSPLQKYEKRLQEIQNNKSLTDQEKSLATVVENREMVRQTFGQGAGQSIRDKEELFAKANTEDQFGRTAFFSETGNRAEADVRSSAARNQLDMEKRQAAGLDATPGQKLKAEADNIADIFGVTGLNMQEIQDKLSPKEFAEYNEAIEASAARQKIAAGVEQTGAEKVAESRKKLQKAVDDGVIDQSEADKAIKKQKDALLSSLGISKTPTQEFEAAVAQIAENASELDPGEIAKGLKAAKDKLLESLGISKSPAQAASETLAKLAEASAAGKISLDELAKGTVAARNTLLQSLGIPLDPVVQLGQRMNDLSEAFSKGLITQGEFTRGQEEARKALPGGEPDSPLKQFNEDMKAVNDALGQGLIDGDDAEGRRQNLRAELQENLKPALDSVAPDRRLASGADNRSKAGVDTFFRILQGRDNPSLKAQRDTARNTQILADAQNQPEARAVLFQLTAR